MPRSIGTHLKRNKRSKAARLRYSRNGRNEVAGTEYGNVARTEYGVEARTVYGQEARTEYGEVARTEYGEVTRTDEYGEVAPFTPCSSDHDVRGIASTSTNLDNIADADVIQHLSDEKYFSNSSEWEADTLSSRIPEWSTKKYVPKKTPKAGIISSDEYERIMAHELAYEYEPRKESPITGNRIVELGYVLDWAIPLQYTHSKICTMGVLSVKKEIRRGCGLTSIIVFECNACEKKYNFHTENPNREKSLINIGAVWGTMATGSTYSHMSEFLSCMDVPTMSHHSFNHNEFELGKEWEASLSMSMQSAGEVEKQIAINNGQLSSDGTPWITVYVDGSWSKRSYGTNFNALSGMVGIIGKNTGELVYVGVRNKYCSICSLAENAGKATKDHICYKNWDSSASAMEADMVVEGFNQSEAMHGVRYGKFIGDGDSSVFSKIQQLVKYGKQVRKVECTNHALKNYGKRLRSIKSDTQINLKGRKMLTIARIKLLTKRAKCSIYEHAKKTAPNVDLLRHDLRNGLHHVFGDHSNCREGICNDVGNISSSLLTDLKSTTIYNHLNGALDLLVRKAHLLIENENNNRAERLMNIVSRFNEGKRLNLIQRGSYRRRVHLSGLRYNKQFQWHSSPYKNVTGTSPGTHFKAFMAKNTRKHELTRKRLFSDTNSDERPMARKKMKHNYSKCNTDYGPQAEQPIVDAELFEKDVDDIINRLKVSKEERDKIQTDSVGQFGNEIFEEERKLRLTASLFGRVMKRRSYTPCSNIVKSCLKSSSFSSEATDYGIAKEKVAIGLFEQLKNRQVIESGLWIDLEHGFLGASPDGIVLDEDSIVEVKCLYSASKLQLKNQCIDEIIDIMKSRICLEKINNEVRLKRGHPYYYQIQGQLNITGKSKCYLIVYVNDNINLFVEEIEKDSELWKEKMCPVLVQFYKECIAPEIVMNNLGKGKKCTDPPFILDAIAMQNAKKTNKQPKTIS